MSKPIRHRGKWRIRWTDENGERRSEVFKEHRDAVFQLRAREREVEEITRGLKLGLPPDKTFNDLCEYWIANRVPQKRSGHHDESIIRAHLRPAFGPVHIRNLGVAQVDAFKSQRTHLDPKTVSNLLTLLISMLNCAVDLNWLAKVPRIRKPRVHLFNQNFRYLRTDEEVGRFLLAARDEDELVHILYASAVYTGMREGELAALRWDDVDLEKRLITVQRSFEGPTKAGDVRYVPILDPLLPVLRAWRLRCGGRLLFPNRDGRMYGKSGRVFQEVLRRVLARGAFAMAERKGKVRGYIVFHDLRHTFASHWVMNGGDLFRLQRILGHKSIQMTQRYAHLAPSEFAKDWGRLGSRSPLEVGCVVVHRGPA
jgi:integrase